MEHPPIASRAFLEAISLIWDTKLVSVIIGIVIFALSMLLTRIFRGHATMMDTVWETLISVGVSVSLAVLLFLAHFLFITPRRVIAEQAETVKNALVQVDKLKGTNGALATAADKTPGQTNIAGQLRHIFTERDKMLVDALKSTNSRAAMLQQIASAPDAIPKIDNAEEITLSDVDAIVASLDEKETKEQARSELARAQGESADQSTMQASFPYIDHYVKEVLEKAARQLAHRHGDKIWSSYTNAAQTFDRGEAIVRMETNSAWAFRVYVRQSRGPGQFSWSIEGPGPPANYPWFACDFSGDSYACRVSDGRPELSGSGKVETLTRTNFIPAIRWLVGVLTQAHPPTNVVATTAK